MQDDDSSSRSSGPALTGTGLSSLDLLFKWWHQTEAPPRESSRGPAPKSRRRTVEDAYMAIMTASQLVTSTSEAQRLIGEYPCREGTMSKDTRGRCQWQIRDGKGGRPNFRPWHVVWVYETDGVPVPRGMGYSHRCQNENCLEWTHGAWETDAENQGRVPCKGASHVILGDRCWTLCSHRPCCLTPVILKEDGSTPLPIPVWNLLGV